jgi:GNAT superfamily N-acetyltransferase
MAVVLRSLRSDEFDDAHGILVNAAEWLVAKRIRQWTIPTWWLSKLATASRFRGRGLGALAVRRVIHFLSEQQVERLYLECVHGKGFLVAFYERIGFRSSIDGPFCTRRDRLTWF